MVNFGSLRWCWPSAPREGQHNLGAGIQGGAKPMDALASPAAASCGRGGSGQSTPRLQKSQRSALRLLVLAAWAVGSFVLVTSPDDPRAPSLLRSNTNGAAGEEAGGSKRRSLAVPPRNASPARGRDAPSRARAPSRHARRDARRARRDHRELIRHWFKDDRPGHKTWRRNTWGWQRNMTKAGVEVEFVADEDRDDWVPHPNKALRHEGILKTPPRWLVKERKFAAKLNAAQAASDVVAAASNAASAATEAAKAQAELHFARGVEAAGRASKQLVVAALAEHE